MLGIASIVPAAQATPFPGPDSFGYTATEIPANQRTLTGAATLLDLGDDGTELGVAIGFPFSFYGTSHTTLVISSNGFLSFEADPEDGCCDGEPLPENDNVNHVIAGYWTDLDTTEGGELRYQTIGTAPNRLFVVEWDDVAYNDCGDSEEEDDFVPYSTVQVQIILHETTNAIEYQYGDLEPCYFLNGDEQEGDIVSIGIEDVTGTIGLQGPFGNATSEFVSDLANSGILIQNLIPPACAGMTFDRTIIGTDGPDTLTGTGLRDLILGLGGNDTLSGGAGNDCIAGGEGADRINGGSGNDKLLGDGGNDNLNGDSGTDSAIGGVGTDTCVAESRTTCEN